MQFPSNSLQKTSSTSTSRSLHMKSNLAWREFQRFFAATQRPLLTLYGQGSGLLWGEAAGPQGQYLYRCSPSPKEQVGGGVLGVLWRIRILRDVMFFVNCSESGVCVCICVSFGCLGTTYLYLMRCSHGSVGRFDSRPQSLKFQHLDEPLNSLLLQYV